MQQAPEDLQCELARAFQAALRDYPAGVPLVTPAAKSSAAPVGRPYQGNDPVILIYSGELFSDDLEFMKKVVTAGLGRSWEVVSLICFSVDGVLDGELERDPCSGAAELPKLAESLLVLSFSQELGDLDTGADKSGNTSEGRVRLTRVNSALQGLTQFAGAPLIIAPEVMEVSASVELKRELWGLIKPFAVPR